MDAGRGSVTNCQAIVVKLRPLSQTVSTELSVTLLRSCRMMSLLNPILAQAAAAPEEVTVGGIITAIMFVMTAVGSMAMIVAWVIRHSQTGHALPAAQRGVLRVPLPLTLVAIFLSVLFTLLVLVSSFSVDPATAVNIVVDGNPTEAEKDPADSDADEKKTTTSARSSGISPAKMQNALIQTIAMDLMMLLAFGAVVLVASQAGRVYLKESTDQHRKPTTGTLTIPRQRDRTAGVGMGFGSPWPDLDDASLIPEMPGYDILGNRVVYDPERNANEIVSEPTVLPKPSAFNSHQPPPNSADHNPFAVVLEDEPLGADPTVDQSFSFSRELRFATEVFLAAYLPTAAMKLLIVLISMSIAGEPPKSHPFLEMLEAGVSVSMIAVILIMAVFVAPIVEELQFRVVVLGGIAQLGRPKLALIASSMLFAFAHGFPDSIALIPLAFALGYTYLRRRSYVTVMLVHFLFNGFNMLLALVALL